MRRSSPSRASRAPRRRLPRASLNAALGLPPSLAAAATAAGTPGALAALKRTARAGWGRRASACARGAATRVLRPQGGVAPGAHAQEVSARCSCAGAASVTRASARSAASSSNAARCNHMDRRCGPPSAGSACCRSRSGAAARSLVAGARPTRARASSFGWRRSVLLAADAASRARSRARWPWAGLHHTTTSRAGSPLAAAARAATVAARPRPSSAPSSSSSPLVPQRPAAAHPPPRRRPVLDLARRRGDARPARRAQVAGAARAARPGAAGRLAPAPHPCVGRLARPRAEPTRP